LTFTIENQACPVDQAFVPDDAQLREFKLADGRLLCMECSEAGLLGGHDFRLASGTVLRFERRIFKTIPALSSIDQRVPQWWASDEEAVRQSKAIFVAYWNGMTEQDRTSFLSKVVNPLSLRRALRRE